jgi:hypothetical protein
MRKFTSPEWWSVGLTLVVSGLVVLRLRDWRPKLEGCPCKPGLGVYQVVLQAGISPNNFNIEGGILVWGDVHLSHLVYQLLDLVIFLLDFLGLVTESWWLGSLGLDFLSLYLESLGWGLTSGFWQLSQIVPPSHAFGPSSFFFHSKFTRYSSHSARKTQKTSYKR